MGGVSIRVPHSDLIIFANLSNSKGSDLTFSAVCTRKREHCIRDLSSCTHRFLKRVRGPSISCVRNLDPTVSVSRGAASGGPHSAINAMARVCSCLELLCTEVNVPRYPIYNERVSRRAISRVISGVLACSRNAGVRVVTPVIHSEGNRCAGRLSSTHGSNCTHIHVSNDVCSLFRAVGLSGGGGRGVRVIISELIIGSDVHDHLASDVRATARLSGNAIVYGVPSNRSRLFSLSCTYPRRNISVRRVDPHVFSFGGPCNTYGYYSNLNAFVRVSRGLIVPGGGLSVGRNTVGTDN